MWHLCIAGNIEYIEVKNIDQNKVFTTDGKILPLNKLNAMLLGIVIYKIKQCDIMLSCLKYEEVLKDINKWLGII